MNRREEDAVRHFLGKETFKYLCPIDFFIRMRQQLSAGIRSSKINSFNEGREIFLKEINGETAHGDGRSIILRAWLDHCKNHRHFEEILSYAIRYAVCSRDMEVATVWAWSRILKSRKDFARFFRTIRRYEKTMSLYIDNETELYMMQKFINICMKPQNQKY